MQQSRSGSPAHVRCHAFAALVALLAAACSVDSSDPLPATQPFPAGSPITGQPQGGSTAPAAGTQAPVGPPQAGAAGSTTGVGMPGGTGGMPAAGAGAAGTGIAGAAGMGSAGTGTAGTMGTAGNRPIEPVECATAAPDEFEPNPSVGGGGSQFVDSPHFRIYGASGASAETALDHLEAAYSCFVETLCWRSSGLSIDDDSDSGPYHKMNIYSVGSLGGAAGQMFSDARAGHSYLRVVSNYLAQPDVTVHEYGHSLTYYEQGWIEQTRTGAWWETVANFVADFYMTSPVCAEARSRFGIETGNTIISLSKVISDSYQVIVDATARSGNYYQAWPFLTYLTNNPDGYAGLGLTALRDMFRNHNRQNETPLHVLERIAAPVTVQTIVGRYWARMAYLDIGHELAQQAFLRSRGSLNFANLESAGSQTWRVRANRQPRYFGANIIPLSGSGQISVEVTSSAAFTATLSIRASSGSVRYVDLPGGSGQATIESGEEASLVVVNTPAALVQYDPFSIGGDVARGLDYTVRITGASPAN